MVAAGVTALAVLGSGVVYASTDGFGTHHVGEITSGGLVLPTDQTIDPIGDRLLFKTGEILASAVSPDGRYLAAQMIGHQIDLAIVDLANNKVVQEAGPSPTADLDVKGTDVGQEGPTYSPDGTTLWMPRSFGFSRFPVHSDGTLGQANRILIPDVGSQQPLPAKSVFSPDGTTLYVAVNGQNRVVAMDPTTGAIEHSWNVGIAPRGLVLVGGKLYVSNEGGRQPQAGDDTLNSYGTQVPVDARTGATTTGTVSVIDTGNPDSPVKNIPVGLHPTALYAKDGAVFVANTASDDVSVIDSTKDQVVQTITTQPWSDATVGYHPDGLALTRDGHLLVTLGRANAVAVYEYTAPQEPVSYIGLLPTDYYPEDVVTRGDEVLVTNLRGIGDLGGNLKTISPGPGTTPAAGPKNTTNTTGSLQRFTLPDDQDIAADTQQVFHQNGWDSASVQERRGGKIAPVPVPRRLGDPSTIKYVYLIIKENRSYDQVFGDMSKGNRDPSLTQFGEDVTPNQHAMARQFGLYDNTYDIGTQSAEGQTWAVQADNPEYTESSAGEYIRSYGTPDDALGHQRSGYLWTGATAAGKSARDFGMVIPFSTAPAGAGWQDYYCDAANMAKTGQDTSLRTDNASPIPSLNSITVHDYPGNGMQYPDQYRYEIWKRDFDANGPANLNVMHLPDNHTGGGAQTPNPIAQVADNDLALGKMVDHISHSKYWKQTAIFVVEDDTSNGIDHVDGTRGPVQIISPWAKHGVVDSHYYTQLTILRTIEQILGIQPLNQRDAAATPMRRAFTKVADDTPFDAVDNRIPLTYGLGEPPACGDDTVAARYKGLAAELAPAPPASMQPLVNEWRAWETRQHFTGKHAVADYADPAQMDRLTWYETHGWTTPFPGDDKVFSPDEVPGAYIPSPDSDG